MMVTVVLDVATIVFHAAVGISIRFLFQCDSQLFCFVDKNGKGPLQTQLLIILLLKYFIYKYFVAI